MRIIDYCVITSSTPFELANGVREQIKKGWQPQGGECCNSYRETYQQAMVKYAKPVYTVVASTSFEGLRDLVNERIAQDWEPQGGICHNPNQDSLIQALIKYEEPK